MIAYRVTVNQLGVDKEDETLSDQTFTVYYETIEQVAHLVKHNGFEKGYKLVKSIQVEVIEIVEKD